MYEFFVTHLTFFHSSTFSLSLSFSLDSLTLPLHINFDTMPVLFLSLKSCYFKSWTKKKSCIGRNKHNLKCSISSVIYMFVLDIFLFYQYKYEFMYIYLSMANIYISNMKFYLCMHTHTHTWMHASAYGVWKKEHFHRLANSMQNDSIVNTNTHTIYLLTSVLVHINSFQLQYALRKSCICASKALEQKIEWEQLKKNTHSGKNRRQSRMLLESESESDIDWERERKKLYRIPIVNIFK